MTGSSATSAAWQSGRCAFFPAVGTVIEPRTTRVCERSPAVDGRRNRSTCVLHDRNHHRHHQKKPRFMFYHGYTVNTPAMIMKLVRLNFWNLSNVAQNRARTPRSVLL
jgi:hypothetical protein